MCDEVRLQVMICSFGSDGAERVMRMPLPRIAGVGYLLSLQDPDADVTDMMLEALRRRGLDVYVHRDRGLGLNRRHALDHADARFVLLADDDLEYDADGLERALEIMESHPQIDIFAFRHVGDSAKIYPDSEHDLSVAYKNYNLTSFEIALRLDALRSRELNFSPLTGVGAPYLAAGEENILVARCLRAGLHGRFFPLTIVRHCGLTTGFKSVTKAGVMRANAAYIRIKYGYIEGLLRCVVVAWRSPLRFVSALRYMLQGYVYSISHDKEL